MKEIIGDREAELAFLMVTRQTLQFNRESEAGKERVS